MCNLQTFAFTILIILLIYILIQNYDSYCYSETDKERFGTMSESYEHFDDIHK